MKLVAIFLIISFAFAAAQVEDRPVVGGSADGPDYSDEVGDYQYFQGPLSNIFRTIRRGLTRGKGADAKIEHTPSRPSENNKIDSDSQTN